MWFVIGYNVGNIISLITATAIMHYVCMVFYRNGWMDNELRKDLRHNSGCQKLSSKENTRLTQGHRASDWNNTKHGAVYMTTYGLLVQHLCFTSFPN